MPPEKKIWDKNWFYFVREIQNFFLSQGFSPVETPTLVSCPGTEPHLEFFSTHKKINEKTEKMWLASSPEMHLKKLLCLGEKKIFEIHKCFRNNESSPLHLNEFYLLEWYRAGAYPEKLIEDIELLLKFLNTKNIISKSANPLKKASVQELFKKYCSVDLTPKTKSETLSQALKNFQIPFEEKSDFDDLFYLLFLNKIEKNMDPDHPLIVYNYPPSLRAYSRLTQEGWANRFEFYWKGLEIANAFYEVHDPIEQKKIFEKDLKKRKFKKEDEGLDFDHDLIQKMKTMPPSSGIALGLERLFMAVYGLKNISSIHPFF